MSNAFDPTTAAIQPIILVDAEDTLIDGSKNLIKPQLLKTLLDVKNYGASLYLATDGSESYATTTAKLLQAYSGSKDDIFTGIFHNTTFQWPKTDRFLKKNDPDYFTRLNVLLEKIGGRHYMLIDDNPENRATAKQKYIETIDGSLPDTAATEDFHKKYKFVTQILNYKP